MKDDELDSVISNTEPYKDLQVSSLIGDTQMLMVDEHICNDNLKPLDE